MSERLSDKIRNILPLSMREAGSLLTAAAVALGFVSCGSQHRAARSPKTTEALAVYLECPDNTRPTTFDKVQHQDSAPGTIAFTCTDSRKDPRQPLSVVPMEIWPYDDYKQTPDAEDLQGPGVTKELIFKLVGTKPLGFEDGRFKLDLPIGSTPFAFIELGAAGTIQGPIPIGPSCSASS